VKNKKISKIISILLLFAIIAGIIPGGIGNLKAEAAGLEMPQRIRPTAETMWNPENIKNTIAAGENHSLFITQTRTVKAVGKNLNGQLGNGTTHSSKEFVDVLGKDGVGLLTDVVAVSAGGDNSLALKADGTVWVWGYKYYWQGNMVFQENRTTPIQVKGGESGEEFLTNIVAISAGDAYSLALKADGTVWAWGYNLNGRLGDGTETDRTTPIQVKGGESGEEFLTDIVAISAGSSHSLALKADGTIWAWGGNSRGALGNGTRTMQITTPVQVKGGESGEEFLTDIVAISAGAAYSLALKADGTVWAWGYNHYGGTETDAAIPIQVRYEPNISFLTDIVAISAGSYHFLALKADGTVVENRETKEEPLINIAAISSSVSSNTLFAIKSDGKIYGWGENGSGQLGDGTTEDKSIPTEITFSGQKQVAIIPENLLYKFTSPKERELYEGNKALSIEWQLISDPVEKFDIYYAPYEGWQDESTWIEIEKNVPTSELNPTSFTSDISDGNGGYLEGTKYQYNWTLPDEFIPHIRIIAIPHYK